jgi:hypothetical protein
MLICLVAVAMPAPFLAFVAAWKALHDKRASQQQKQHPKTIEQLKLTVTMSNT